MLLGLRSILDAHTSHEKVAKSALLQAADTYVDLVQRLLKESAD